MQRRPRGQAWKERAGSGSCGVEGDVPWCVCVGWGDAAAGRTGLSPCCWVIVRTGDEGCAWHTPGYMASAHFSAFIFFLHFSLRPGVIGFFHPPGLGSWMKGAMPAFRIAPLSCQHPACLTLSASWLSRPPRRGSGQRGLNLGSGGALTQILAQGSLNLGSQRGHEPLKHKVTKITGDVCVCVCVCFLGRGTALAFIRFSARSQSHERLQTTKF